MNKTTCNPTSTGFSAAATASLLSPCHLGPGSKKGPFSRVCGQLAELWDAAVEGAPSSALLSRCFRVMLWSPVDLVSCPLGHTSQSERRCHTACPHK